MDGHNRRRRGDRALRVGHKVVVAVGLLVPAVLTIAAAGLYGLSALHDTSRHLYEDTLQVTATVARLDGELATMGQRSFEVASTDDPARAAALEAELRDVWTPRVRDTLHELAELVEGDDEGKHFVTEVQVAFREYEDLLRNGAYLPAGQDAEALQRRSDALRRTWALFDRMNQGSHQRLAVEMEHADENIVENGNVYRFTRALIGITVVLSLVLALGGILWLVRSLVPRIRRYSAFAIACADGRPVELLQPKGRDELAELGRALNDMVEQRREVSAREASQAEFLDTLQVTENEDEAQEVLRRHLERSVSGSTVIVLQRNNSANRLEPVTPVDPDGDLAQRLVAAQPRSCLALRFARTHLEGLGRDSLMHCGVCADTCPESLCEPLVVGGEVIGSVLLTQAEKWAEDDGARIKSTVAQAAPMLANLRNLALAEFRANNDSLTGLPNKRAAEDTLKRMVAQANRSVSPLAVILLDLDFFKQINDRYGHSKGHEVLAAVGTCLQAAIRASDFAGRFGGEEFLVLLPDTARVSAVVVAEKIRHTIASIVVPEVDGDVTASLGIAVLPDHAGHAEGLLREADHALYTAKATGRNRVVVAGDPPIHDAPDRPPDAQFARDDRPAG